MEGKRNLLLPSAWQVCHGTRRTRENRAHPPLWLGDERNIWAGVEDLMVVVALVSRGSSVAEVSHGMPCAERAPVAQLQGCLA
jgi:hypothetical protein